MSCIITGIMSKINLTKNKTFQVHALNREDASDRRPPLEHSSASAKRNWKGCMVTNVSDTQPVKWTAHQSRRQSLIPSPHHTIEDVHWPTQRCIPFDHIRLKSRAFTIQTNPEVTATLEFIWSFEHVQTPDGMHHDEKDLNSGASCRPRSGHLENSNLFADKIRATDLQSDAGDLDGDKQFMYARTFSKRTPGVPPKTSTLQSPQVSKMRNHVASDEDSGQDPLRSSLGLARFATTDDTNGRIWDILPRTHKKNAGHIEFGSWRPCQRLPNSPTSPPGRWDSAKMAEPGAKVSCGVLLMWELTSGIESMAW